MSCMDGRNTSTNVYGNVAEPHLEEPALVQVLQTAYGEVHGHTYLPEQIDALIEHLKAAKDAVLAGKCYEGGDRYGSKIST